MSNEHTDSDYRPHGVSIVQDGGFNKFTWMLLAAFGSLLMLLGAASLSKMWAMGERQAEQAGDIKVILANQHFQTQNYSNLAADIKDLRLRLAEIERRQLETTNARR